MRERLHALWQHLRREHTAPGRLAAAVFLGVNVGVWPIYGVQTPLCLVLAQLLRLNKLTVVLAANISNPLFAPILVAIGIGIGEWIRFGTLTRPDLQQASGFLDGLSLFAGEVPRLYVSCFVGSIVLGILLGGVLATVTYFVAARRGSPNGTTEPHGEAGAP